MRIVQLITELRPAGAEQVVSTLSVGLKNRGHEVHVIALQKIPTDSPVVTNLLKHKIPVIGLNITKLTPWRILEIRKVYQKIGPHLVHSHLIHANIASRLFCPPAPAVLFNTVHIAERRRGKGWHFLLDRLTFNRCDCQTCVSHAVKEFHAHRIGVDKACFPVVYNGVPQIKLLNEQQISTLIAEWGLQDCSRIVGSVGRLDYQKGYDMLLGLLKRAAGYLATGEKIGVVILGEGPERKRLERIAGEIPENISVRLPGFRADAANCIGAFNLYVMPSRYEGFGLTLVEAMAHGVPILINSVDSLPELIRGYENGECINFGRESPAEFSNRVIHQSKKKKIEPWTPFSIDSMVNSYETLYKEITPFCARER